MPLPDASISWPPSDVSASYSSVHEWAAWWSGDPNKLAAFYGGQDAGEDFRKRRPFMFWTRRNDRAPSASEVKLHVPAAGDLATFSADLLFSEAPTFKLPDDASVEQADALESIVWEADLHNVLLEAAEAAAALGGVYLRPTWDKEVSDVPFAVAIHPDNAVPEFRWGRLVAVTFWKVVNPEGLEEPTGTDGTRKVYRVLERHEVDETGQAVIRHAAYRGTASKLGDRLTLAEYPPLLELVAGLEDGEFIEELDEVVVPIPGLDRLDVVYVPNMRPNRRHRGSPFGRSDFEGLEGPMDALDETYTSWIRDIRLGKSRIIVPDQFVEKRGRGSGGHFDVDAEVFTPLEMDPTSQEKAGIQRVQFDIRTEAHSATALALFEQIVTGAGYAPQSFGLHIEGRAESGTALRLRERKSFITQGKKARYWKGPLETLVQSLLVIDREVFDGPREDAVRPTVEFGDSISTSPTEVAQSLVALKQAQSASARVRVEMLHPDWTDEQIEEEVTRIAEEEGLAVPSPFEVGGSDSGATIPPGFEPDEEEPEGEE